MASKAVRTWAYGGCGVALGAGAVGCGGVAALGVLALVVTTSQWEAATRALLEGQTNGEITFDDLDVSIGRVAFDGFRVRLGPKGSDLIRIERLVVGAGVSAFGDDPVRVGTVRARGVTIDAVRTEAGWQLPPATSALLANGSSSYDWPALAVDRILVEDLTATGTTPDGATTAAIERIEAEGLAADLQGGLTWSIDGFAVGAATASTGGTPFASIAAIEAGPDGVMTVRDLAVEATARPDRTLDVPPVVADLAPAWMGGHREVAPDEAPWLGLEPFAGWPIVPDRVRVEGAALSLTDTAFVAPPVAWEIGLATAQIGPPADDALPLVATGTLAGGELVVEGEVRSDGTIAVDLQHRGGNMGFYEPYLRSTLRTLSLSLGRGVASADLRTEFKGSRFAMNGAVRGSHLRFVAANSDDAGSAIVGAGSRLLTANEDEPIAVPVSVRGDLTDPNFSPVRRVVANVDNVLTSRARGVVSDVVGGVKRTFRKIFGKD